MVIFRENTEDIYAGLEVEAGGTDDAKLIAFLRACLPSSTMLRLEHPPSRARGIGIKPVCETGLEAAHPRPPSTTP